MCPDVKAFLRRVEEADLFNNVGHPITAAGVVQLTTWAEALRSQDSQAWEDFQLDRHNEMASCEPIVEAHSDYAKADDAFVTNVKACLNGLIEPLLSTLPLSDDGRLSVHNETRWQLLHACYEIQYRHLYTVYWHNELAEWYFRGHFPCGWEGDWPEGAMRKGRLMVF